MLRIDTEPPRLFVILFNLASGAGSTTDDKKRNERTTTRFPIYGTKLPTFEPIPIIGQKCFPPLQASIGCKNCRKELLLSNQKTKKEAHIERELFNQCTSNPNAHCPNATLRLI